MPPRLPPATPAGEAFGQPSVPSSAGKTDERLGKKENDGLPFLSHTVCLLCNERLIDGIEKGLTFWMTSCGHVLCDKREHEHKPDVCTACRKAMKAVAIQQGHLSRELERWFVDPEGELDNAEADIQALGQKLKSARQVMKFQIGHRRRSSALHDKQLVAENERVKMEMEKLTVENERLRGELQAVLQENEDLKIRSMRPPAPSEHGSAMQVDYNPQIAQTYLGPHHRSRTLPTVLEEQYEDHQGGLNRNAQQEMDLEHLVGKRQRTDLQPRGAPMVPYRNAPTPTLSLVAGNQPFATPQRSRSVAGYGPGNAVGGASSTPRVDLNYYRLDPNNVKRPSSTLQQYTPSHLNNGRTTPMGRSVSEQPQMARRQGDMLPPATYNTRGQNDAEQYRTALSPEVEPQDYANHITGLPQQTHQYEPQQHHYDAAQQGGHNHDYGNDGGSRRVSDQGQSRVSLSTRPRTRMPPPF